MFQSKLILFSFTFHSLLYLFSLQCDLWNYCYTEMVGLWDRFPIPPVLSPSLITGPSKARARRWSGTFLTFQCCPYLYMWYLRRAWNLMWPCLFVFHDGVHFWLLGSDSLWGWENFPAPFIKVCKSETSYLLTFINLIKQSS